MPDVPEGGRYDEVIRRYLTVRDASSREWGISPTLVMAVELDVSADTYQMLWIANSSARRISVHLLRVTLFRFYGLPEGEVIHAWDATRPERGRLTAEEEQAIAQHQVAIDEWVQGRADRLMASTTTRLSRRLAQQRR